MRDASAWIVTCALAVGALPGSLASAQDMVPDEEAMELQGMPPITPQPPAAVVTDTEGPAPDSSSAALSANAELLDRLFITATEKTIREQKFAAAAGVTGGMILVGIGSWRLTEKDPQSQFSRGLGVMFMTLGMVDLTTGVFAATRVSHEKRRLERWEKVRKDGITELELARAEGELLASSETREGERLLVRWTGLTHAIAGVLVLSFSPVPNTSRTDRVSAYIIGSLFIGTGMAAFGLSYRPTPSEAAWKEYQAKKVSASGQQVSWQVSPSISRRGFGLGLTGTF